MKKITKKDYEELLKWATREIDEWNKFIKDLKKRYENCKKCK